MLLTDILALMRIYVLVMKGKRCNKVLPTLPSSPKSQCLDALDRYIKILLSLRQIPATYASTIRCKRSHSGLTLCQQLLRLQQSKTALHNLFLPRPLLLSRAYSLYTPISIKLASVMHDPYSLFHRPQSIMLAINKCNNRFSH